MAKPLKKKKSRIAQTSKMRTKLHPWRPCPLGQNWVVTHTYRVRPSKKHPNGSVATQSGHCRTNPSKKDHLYKDDIIEIAQRYFSSLKGPPSDNSLNFKNGDKFDELIRGWTKYWNEVLEPDQPLDPNLVKALIASESSFIPTKWNGLHGGYAGYGLMQMLNKSVQLLKNSRELSDHFVNLNDDDMNDPNLNVCAGIRWLFRKRDLASAKMHEAATWRDAVAAYKGVSPDHTFMKNFDKYYHRLTGLK